MTEFQSGPDLAHPTLMMSTTCLIVQSEGSFRDFSRHKLHLQSQKSEDHRTFCFLVHTLQLYHSTAQDPVSPRLDCLKAVFLCTLVPLFNPPSMPSKLGFSFCCPCFISKLTDCFLREAFCALGQLISWSAWISFFRMCCHTTLSITSISILV